MKTELLKIVVTFPATSVNKTFNCPLLMQTKKL